MPLYETSRTGNCTNPYGWTKYVCEQILRDHAERLDKIAGFLMENENMSRAQFEAVMQDETLDQPKA